MEDCLFCKILSGAIPCKKAYENDSVFAFHDIHPVSPTHILIIPKKHIPSVAESREDNKEILGNLLLAAKVIASDLKIDDYRLVINNGRKVGQSVFHIHIHLLAGRFFSWPPG